VGHRCYAATALLFTRSLPPVQTIAEGGTPAGGPELDGFHVLRLSISIRSR
jgi:hypothetical protein